MMKVKKEKHVTCVNKQIFYFYRKKNVSKKTKHLCKFTLNLILYIVLIIFVYPFVVIT